MKFGSHNYQQYAIERVINSRALGLFLDMGLGKTVITLTAIEQLKYDYFDISRVLVIAPKKVAESTWMNEKDKWDHLQKLKINLVLGVQKKRLAALSMPGDIWVVNRENTHWLVDYYRSDWPFDMVVVDEFSSFKNHQAKRFKYLSWVRPHIKRFIGLTGTPAPNGLMDLWAQIYLLDGGKRLYDKISKYKTRYFNVVDEWGGCRIKPGADILIQDAISDICVSMKAEDYLELPDCTIVDVPVALDEEAKQAYMRLEKDMLLEVDDSQIDATSAAALSIKLLQLCNGAVYDADQNTVIVHNCKIEALLELIEGLNDKPVIIAYQYKHDLLRLKKVLPQAVEYKTPQNEIDWNAGRIKVMLMQPQSSCYGLNLQQGGNYIIWFSLTWNLEQYQQFNKRLHRQGQKEKVFIYRLITQIGRDKDVIRALECKGNAQDLLLESLKARIREVKA